MIKFLLMFLGLISYPLSEGEGKAVHPIHLSVCEVKLNPNSHKLEIGLKLFIDDLEDAIRLQGKPAIYIGTEKEKPIADSLIFDYIRQRFEIIQGESPLSFKWVGKENSEDFMAVWCYFESEALSLPYQSIQFKNCILMELFGDQKNILHASLSPLKDQHHLFTQRQCRN